jgi:DNA ligase (NAD+)
MNRIEELRTQLTGYNEAYRKGNALISDAAYDTLVDELQLLSPNDPFFERVGISISDEDPRKQKLPIHMASMNKTKTVEEIFRWLRLKHIPEGTLLVITPKFDGLSFCVDEDTQGAWTRGDGHYGQRSDDHYRAIIGNVPPPAPNPFAGLITYGEVLMSRHVFAERWADTLENPRNTVAGALNNKQPTAILSDLAFIRYGIVAKNNSLHTFSSKAQQLEFLNRYQPYPVPYQVVSPHQLSEAFLKDCFARWNAEYELDGIIIEVNNLQLQAHLGRETSTHNPAFARAYKGEFEEVKETVIVGRTWNVTKQGLLKPVNHIHPVRLDGVTVSNVTGNNAKFVLDMQLGIGSRVKVKRSGMVIPLIVSVVESAPVTDLPEKCPACGSDELGWNESGVELMCLNVDCSGQALQRMIAFFTTLEVDHVSEGVCSQFYAAGFDTIHKVLAMSREDMESLDRFGKRKAEIIYNAIHSKLTHVPLAKLQHATGLFKGLGSRKLLLLEHFEQKPSLADVCAISGFSEISATAYLEAYDKFFAFIQGMPLQIAKTQKSKPLWGELSGKSFCFTGIRRADLEKIITEKGGNVASGVSKNLSFLVVKAKGSGSSKEVKATALGIPILSVEEAEAMLLAG